MHVPRRLVRWALIFALAMWVAALTTVGWGVWQSFTESKQFLNEMLLEGEK